jgi:hypothetical protein
MKYTLYIRGHHSPVIRWGTLLVLEVGLPRRPTLPQRPRLVIARSMTRCAGMQALQRQRYR